MRLLKSVLVVLCLIAPVLVAQPAAAQSSPGFFIPPPAAPKTAPAAPSRRTTRAARPAPVAAAPLPDPDPQPEAQPQDQAQEPMPPLPQPPVPALPPIAKGIAPPTPVVGVLGVPDIMRQSSAAQIVEKIVGARKEKLRVDVERAQSTWRDLERSLQNDAPKLTPDQGRARERDLRDRVNTDRRQLQARNRIIQEAGQVALGQIERTLVAIIRQVADSRGMNLVLHRSQVALNVQEFDITDAVVQQLNKVLPTVQIPAEDVDPATLPRDWGTPPGIAAATTASH